MDPTMATAQQMTDKPYRGIEANTVSARPAPEPVDAELTKELAQRAEYHGQEANWLEEAARRHRAAERACRSGVDSLEMAKMEQSQPEQPRY